MQVSSRQIRQHFSLMGLVDRTIDASCIVTALYCAARSSDLLTDNLLVAVGALAVVFFLLISELIGLYRNWLGVTPHREVVCVLSTWGCTLLAMLTVGFVTSPTVEYSRHSLIVWLLVAPALMIVSRLVVRFVQQSLRTRGVGVRGFAIVGVNQLGFDLANNIEASPELGLKMIGFYDDRPSERTEELPADIGSRIGDIAELVEQARDGRVDMIYITFPMRAEQRIRDVLKQLSDTTASVYVVPDFFVFQLLHSRWSDINGLPVVSVFDSPFYGVDGLMKRATDLILTTAILIAAAIPMACIALLVRLTSPGPIFFLQKRYGLDGREIRVWKFRTMRVCENDDRVVQATKGDARITPLGTLLRKSSLDELPQLFNVLEGTMSLVGPRPHASAHNEEYRKLIRGYMLRHKVKPGITGLAQVNGWRGETDTLEKMEKRVECDHQYIREWSLWLDLKILVRTFFVVLSRQNAY